MRIQIWSYNYDPEPSGIGPLSTVVAQELKGRGHSVTVVAAHPHYPAPVWGERRRPYRESRDGITVLRLPLAAGRATLGARVRQEASYSAALAAVAPWLETPDVIVAVSPSFPALLPAMCNAAGRRIPWVLWLQDILPDGASATGLLRDGAVVRAARQFERLAYRSARRVIVISDSFAENLRAKGVPQEKLVRIYNPASRLAHARPRDPAEQDPATVLTMGNIGHTQNLVAVTRAFERSPELSALGARFVMAGDGVAGPEVRAAILTDRVEVTGILDSERLDRWLRRATLGLVSQRYDGTDFNVPSKLMNLMAYGIPVVGSVRPDSEVARLLQSSGAGWTADSADLEGMTRMVAAALADPEERARRGEAGYRFAREHFAPARAAKRFEEVLEEVVSGSARARSWRLPVVRTPAPSPPARRPGNRGPSHPAGAAVGELQGPRPEPPDRPPVG